MIKYYGINESLSIRCSSKELKSNKKLLTISQEVSVIIFDSIQNQNNDMMKILQREINHFGNVFP